MKQNWGMGSKQMGRERGRKRENERKEEKVLR